MSAAAAAYPSRSSSESAADGSELWVPLLGSISLCTPETGLEGLPDLKAKGSKKGKQRATSKGNHTSEALGQLTRQTREAVRELKEPTATMDVQGDDMDPERMVEDFVNLLYVFVTVGEAGLINLWFLMYILELVHEKICSILPDERGLLVDK
ncbi:hypothetical protein QJS10_CPA07g00361 [Acorus calamus]|uniref:Uncharacterized protein n=1 Tax=Acorus calamus TaxID=4465 RepID=A0AAV9EHY3_ACOCL|nr:hypothetical protein QJS10_CPA07g00361 [Acorus calamus]